MKKVIIMLCIAICHYAFAENVYKWTDSKGNVHFGDKPHRNAVEINVPEAQTFSPPPIPKIIKKDVATKKLVDNKYKEVSIVQPLNEATIRNNQGFVTISVALKPELMPGDKFQLIVDQSPQGQPQTAKHFILSNVNRGTHTVSVQVINKSGKVLAESNTITFYVHRPRVGMVPATRPGN